MFKAPYPDADGFRQDADFIYNDDEWRKALVDELRELAGTGRARRKAYLEIKKFMEDLDKGKVWSGKDQHLLLTDMFKGLKARSIDWPLMPLLAWFCYHHEERAAAFYEASGLTERFNVRPRRYIGQPGEWTKSIKEGAKGNDLPSKLQSGENTPDFLLLHLAGDNIGIVGDILRTMGQSGIVSKHFALSKGEGLAAKARSPAEQALVPALFISSYLLMQLRLNTDLAQELDRLLAMSGDNLIGIRSGTERREIARYSKELAELPFLDIHMGEARIVEQLSRAVQLQRSDENGLSGFKMRLALRQSGQRLIEETLSLTYSADSIARMSVAIIDIDRLSQINRKYGYDAGDYVVYAMGGLLSEQLAGKSHKIELCGADAYVVLMPSDEVATALSGLAERLEEVQWGPWPDLHVTCSIGYAVRQDRENGTDVAIRAALGMMVAKRKGVNRIEKGPRDLERRTSRKVSRYVS